MTLIDLRNFKRKILENAESQTWGCWVISKYATTVHFSPHFNRSLLNQSRSIDNYIHFQKFCILGLRKKRLGQNKTTSSQLGPQIPLILRLLRYVHLNWILSLPTIEAVALNLASKSWTTKTVSHLGYLTSKPTEKLAFAILSSSTATSLIYSTAADASCESHDCQKMFISAKKIAKTKPTMVKKRPLGFLPLNNDFKWNKKNRARAFLNF